MRWIDSRREAAWRLAVVGPALAFFALYRPPAEPALRLCGFHWLTGRSCPLCGLTRALCALAQGDWQGGLYFHPLSPLALALLLWIALGAAVGLLAPRRSRRRS